MALLIGCLTCKFAHMHLDSQNPHKNQMKWYVCNPSPPIGRWRHRRENPQKFRAS